MTFLVRNCLSFLLSRDSFDGASDQFLCFLYRSVGNVRVRIQISRACQPLTVGKEGASWHCLVLCVDACGGGPDLTYKCTHTKI